MYLVKKNKINFSYLEHSNSKCCLYIWIKNERGVIKVKVIKERIIQIDKNKNKILIIILEKIRVKKFISQVTH